MNFKPMMVEKILAGQKTVTRRPIDTSKPRPYGPGKEYAVCPGRGKNQLARILVWSVEPQYLGDVTNDEAIKEGFDSEQAFMEYWASLYGGKCDPLQLVWRIEFELVP